MAEDERETDSAEVVHARREIRHVDLEIRALELRLQEDLPIDEFTGMRTELEYLQDVRTRLEAQLERAEGMSNQSIVVTGGDVTINSGFVQTGITSSTVNTGRAAAGPRSSSDRRAEFVYGSYEDERREAKLTFWLSLGVASVAAIFALSAAGVALFHGGDQSTKWVATFVSSAVAVGGGVWHKHARDARAKVSEHVERVEKQVEADDLYEKTNARIDRIQDPQMRDRANAATLVAELGFQADPDTLTDRVIGSSTTAPELPSATEPASEHQDPDART